MAFRAAPTVGLDIGSRLVKAVQLKRSGKNIELERFGLADIYGGGERPADAAEQRAATVNAIQRALNN